MASNMLALYLLLCRQAKGADRRNQIVTLQGEIDSLSQRESVSPSRAEHELAESGFNLNTALQDFTRRQAVPTAQALTIQVSIGCVHRFLQTVNAGED